MTEDVRVFADAHTLARESADALTALLADLTRRDPRLGPVDLAIAGGFVSSCVLAHVDRPTTRRADSGEPSVLPTSGPHPDWSRVRVWWADERFVRADSPQRNDADAVRTLFRRTPAVELHPMPADEGTLTLEAAGRQYLAQWRTMMGGRVLDLAVLGMGPDGHVASLFPHRPTLETVEEVVVEPHSPKPPPSRITLSGRVLTSASRIWVIAAGQPKAQAFGRAFAGADPRDVPAAALRGPRTTWWVDQEAAAQLPVADR